MRRGLRKGCGWLAVGAAIAPLSAYGGGPLQWDLSTDDGIQGGSGIWNTSLAHWSANGAAPVAWSNGGSNTAVFGGSAGGTIQLPSAITAAGVQFDTPGYQIGVANSPTLTLSTGSIAANADALFLAPINAPLGIVKSGTATVTLSSPATNGGTVSILGGAIAFAAQTSLGITARAIDLSGGRLQYTGGGSLLLAAGRTVSVGTSGGGIDTPAGALLLAGSNQLGGAGLLTKLGVGTLRIQSFNNAFSGSVRVDAGTLSLEDGGALHRRLITLAGGTLWLRGETGVDFQSPVAVTGDARIDPDRLTANGMIAGTHTLPSVTVNGGATLTAGGFDRNYLTVTDVTLTGGLRIDNTALRVTGTLSGGGAVSFTGTAQPGATLDRGLIFASGTAQAIGNSFSSAAAGAPVIVAVDAGSTVTYAGTWDGGGAGVDNMLLLRGGGTFIAGAAARLNTLTADVRSARPFTVTGSGTGGTLELAATFAADHTAGATVANGFCALEVRDATLITRATQSLPVVAKNDGFGGTHRAGAITFSGTAGARWIVATGNQTYDGGVTFNSNATIQADSDLTHVGTVAAKFDGQFQLPVAGVTVTKTGAGWLTLAGSQGYAPGSVMAISTGGARFSSDPGAGYYTGQFTRGIDGNVLAAPAPAGTLAVQVSGGATAEFAAPVSRIASLAVAAGGSARVALGAQAGDDTLVTAALTITGNGQLNLTNNRLVVDYSASAPVGSVAAAVSGLVKSGYNAAGSHWQGGGIVSGNAAADASLAVGYAEASVALNISGSQTATFGGATVDASSVLVRLTRSGDTNLDGLVTFGDFQRFERGFGKPGDWYGGDFNYDGNVDAADFALLYQNFGRSIDSPAPASPADQAALAVFANAFVPEPGCVAWVGLAALLMRRRRRHWG